MPASAAQIEANRANAQKARGPKTAEDPSRAGPAAVRAGLLAPAGPDDVLWAGDLSRWTG